MRIDDTLTCESLRPQVESFLEMAGPKLLRLDETWDPAEGTPVFTVAGRYTTRGWTEWTQGFQYGCLLLQFEATDDRRFLELGRQRTLERMAPHLTHTGVHDHGFNNVSTYGNLRRLMLSGRIPGDERELELYELALKVSGAVQASRWSEVAEDHGFIHSFNGPHSLFADTIRTLRILALAHQLGHTLMGEGDRPISLLQRLLRHAHATVTFNVYYGDGRDAYDVPGRVAHESIFNLNDGQYRCPSTQQGYSPFSTWTRGLAWVLCGCAEQLEWLAELCPADSGLRAGCAEVEFYLERAARATAEFYIDNTSLDGIPFWDTGAPGLALLGDYRQAVADPYNDHEPVDSSAAVIAAQGLWRLGACLQARARMLQTAGDLVAAQDVRDHETAAARYRQAALTVARSLFSEPYISSNPDHQGLLLHSVYHRPNGWDHIPEGRSIPCGESSMWGDYHAMELAVMLHQAARGETVFTFFR